MGAVLSKLLGTGQGTQLRLARLFFALFLLTFSFQVRTLLFQPSVYVTGNFNAYTVFFLSLSDIFLAFTTLFFGLAVAFQQKTLQPLNGAARWLFLHLFLLAVSLLAPAFWSEVPLLAALSALRFFEWLLVVYFVATELLPVRSVLLFFGAGLLFQSVLAVGQYALQTSLLAGGPLGFLGEPLLGPNVAGVAKMDVGGEKLIRAYGTFPHPNVLAGALGMGLMGLFFGRKKLLGSGGSVFSTSNGQRMLIFLTVFFVVLLGAALVVTFSRGAFVALLLGMVVTAVVFPQSSTAHFITFQRFPRMKKFFLKTGRMFFVVIFLLVVVTTLLFQSQPLRERFLRPDDSGSITERVMYLEAAGRMVLAHPLGVGAGHFTLALPDFVVTSLPPWEFQPVHNVYVLAFAEGGMVAGVLFVALWVFIFWALLVKLLGGFSLASKSFQKVQQKDRLWTASLLGCGTFLMTISLFDHYLFTLPQGQVLLYLYFGLVAVETSSIMPSSIR